MLYRCIACLMALAPALASWSALPARADTVEFQVRGTSPLTSTFSVVAVPFVPGEITDKITFEASLAPQSTLIKFPTLSEAGGTGRLDKVSFWNGNALGNLHLVTNFFVDALDPEEGIWLVRGNYHIDGRMRLISNGATLATKSLADTFFHGCGGIAPAPCTIDRSYVLFSGDTTTTLLGPEPPSTVELVIDQLRIFGKLNDDRGKFSGGEYSGYWSNDAAIFEVEYEYTPISAVPLPGAAWLFLSALSALGLARFRRAVHARP